MTKTLVSVDLDWLNGANDPVCKLKELLCHIPNNIPAIMTVEHHEFLPKLHQWVESGEVITPFDVINLDEHHDYYCHDPPFDPCGNQVHCGVWGYRLPLDWYERYTWVHNKQSELVDWESAESWFTDVGIFCSRRSHHLLDELNGDIVAAIFCVSPDYLNYEMQDIIHEVIEIVVNHFGLEKAPTMVRGSNIMVVKGWRITPRPLKVRIFK